MGIHVARRLNYIDKVQPLLFSLALGLQNNDILTVPLRCDG